MSCRVLAVPAPSLYGSMASTLLGMPTDRLSDPENELTKEAQEILDRANYKAGKIYLIVLQERAKTEQGSEEHLHWSGALAAVKRILRGHVTQGWPKDDTR